MKENIQTSQAKLVQGVQGSRVQSPSSLNSQTGSGRVPSTLNPHPSTFSFGPSVQVDLFAYLKPHQQATLRPYLRLIKRPYQEKLCVSLLDYLEGNGLDTLSEPVLALFQEEIVRVCHLHPLTTRDSRFRIHDSREPKSIGTVIKQLFPSLKGLSSLNPQL